jgi:hypothetical protein
MANSTVIATLANRMDEDEKAAISNLVGRWRRELTPDQAALFDGDNSLQTGSKTVRAKSRLAAGATQKRRKQTVRPVKKLTDKQIEAVQLYGELRDFTAVGNRMGISRQAAQKHYIAAQKKLGRTVLSTPKTHSLPTDLRGQATIADPST